MATREPEHWRTTIKVSLERRALKQCLDHVPDLSGGILDMPCGPGRLFPAWAKYDVPVYGIDYSDEFVEAASAIHEELGLSGRVGHGDAFDKEKILDFLEGHTPSVAASIRFIYYFGSMKRRRYLEILRDMGFEYVLTQYIIRNSPKSRWKRYSRRLRNRQVSRERGPHIERRALRSSRVLEELDTAGLEVLEFVPVAPVSDRYFVLGRFRG